MARLPEWAQWQADNPPSGYPPKSNRRFWHAMVWEIRFWLTFAVLMVALGVAFLVWALVHVSSG
jgi:hypothetical protein